MLSHPRIDVTSPPSPPLGSPTFSCKLDLSRKSSCPISLVKHLKKFSRASASFLSIAFATSFYFDSFLVASLLGDIETYILPHHIVWKFFLRRLRLEKKVGVFRCWVPGPLMALFSYRQHFSNTLLFSTSLPTLGGDPAQYRFRAKNMACWKKKIHFQQSITQWTESSFTCPMRRHSMTEMCRRNRKDGLPCVDHYLKRNQ